MPISPVALEAVKRTDSDAATGASPPRATLPSVSPPTSAFVLP